MKTPNGKDTNVPGKTPEEIKKGLSVCCNPNSVCEEDCTYADWNDYFICRNKVMADALAYIQQLEAQIIRCIDCKHSAIDAYSNRRMCIRNGEIKPNGRIRFGVAVNDDHFCGYVEPPKED